MKRILLIITIILIIFQIVALAIDIDIGYPANNYAGSTSPSTNVSRANPANESGKITSVSVWVEASYGTLTNVEIAIFYIVSGNNLSTRSSQSVADLATGFQTVPVNLNVQAGDVIGIFYTAGRISKDNTGADGWWYLAGDNIPCTDTTFTLSATQCLSLYGSGTTEVGWPHKWNTQTISKWNTKESTKWNDLE